MPNRTNRPSAATQAALNSEAASTLPREAPSGTETCPQGSIRIGVFFDGTNNNMYRDWPLKKPSNVARLFKVYKREGTVLTSQYHIGVGSDEEKKGLGWLKEKALGNGFGLGGQDRVSWGMKIVQEFFNRGKNPLALHKVIDVYGFSRGAAIARDFANAVKKYGVDWVAKGPIRSEWIYVDPMVPPVEVKVYANLEHVELYFLGIFDTVSSFTVPGQDMDLGYDFNVDPKWVKHTVHHVAEDEVRSMFPLQSVKGKSKWKVWKDVEKLPPNIEEIPYPGAHSDVGGGGYAPGDDGKDNGLCKIPLRDMHAASLKQGVPFLPLSAMGDAVYWQIPGELLSAYNAYVGERAGVLGQNYLQALPHGEYVTAYKARAKLPSWQKLLEGYIHDSRWPNDKFRQFLRDLDNLWIFDDPLQRKVFYNAARE